jgi:hypothetical protein
MRGARKTTTTLAAVKRALELGWKAAEGNTRATRHFYFFGPSLPEFSVSWYTGLNYPIYSVDNESSSNALQALMWLNRAHEQRKESSR